MTKILIVFTGGTIGSSISDSTIAPDAATKYCLIDNYINAHSDSDVTFDSVEPYMILSENLAAKHINALSNCIYDNLDKGYDGIIVTHGTDTLQFTAAALRYAFADVDIPIMIVSSNFPLSVKQANGNINFSGAVEFVKRKIANGVFVAYSNDLRTVKFHSPERLLMHQEARDEVASLGGEYAELVGNDIVVNNAAEPLTAIKGIGKLNLDTESKILVSSCFPGDSYLFDLDNYAAVIFRPYHSGTLNTADEEIRDFCEKIKERKIPAFVVNVPDGNIYESAVLYKEMGLTALPRSTFADTYMRIWIEISAGLAIK